MLFCKGITSLVVFRYVYLSIGVFKNLFLKPTQKASNTYVKKLNFSRVLEFKEVQF